MVQADGRHDRECRQQHVGRIQPSPEAHLDDGRIHPFIGKPLERQSRRNFEERKFLLHKIRLPLRQEVEHVLLGDQGIFGFAKRRGALSYGSRYDPRPFPKIQQMRRSIKPGPESARAQSRGQQGGDGALAVGPGDMDGLESPLRMAEGGTEGLHALQARFVSRTESGLLDRRETHENLLQQLPVGSFRKLHSGDFFDFITNLPIFGQK